jgi:hypothetical protein
MGNTVFANSNEIASKSMSGKSICQFPDTCFTPPQTPATPTGVPIPYPNTAFASDTSDGSKSVVIGGEEVMLKDKSFFKKSSGDEAGSAPNKGLMTSTNQGSAYFIAWSMDVKFEGENVVRNLDMTTHNHGSANATGLAPTVHAATAALGKLGDCAGDAEKIKQNCEEDNSNQCPGALATSVEKGQKDWVRMEKGASVVAAVGAEAAMAAHRGTSRFVASDSATANAARMATHDASANANKCVQAMRCFLRPKEPHSDQTGCCEGQTPHHIPPDVYMTHLPTYSYGQALCICLESMNQHLGSHGDNHALVDYYATTLNLSGDPKKPETLSTQSSPKLKDANKVCAKASAAQTGCSEACIEQQLDEHFKNDQKLDPETTEVKYKKLAKPEAIAAAKPTARAYAVAQLVNIAR